MHWLLASIMANASIAVVEYQNRAGGFESICQALPTTLPFIVIAQVGLFYAWNGAPSFMTAWAFFTAGNLGLRLISNHFLVGETLNLAGWLGVAMVVAGAQIVKWAGRAL